MSSILDIAWTLFPTTAKIGFGVYYAVNNARKTYETVAFLSQFVPSREKQTMASHPWVWVQKEDNEFFEVENARA